jgi:hypothetical protein
VISASSYSQSFPRFADKKLPVDRRKFLFFGRSKNFKKSEKKACQLLTGSLNGWIDATKGPESRSKKL